MSILKTRKTLMAFALVLFIAIGAIASQMIALRSISAELDTSKITSEYDSRDEAIQAASDFNEKIAEEGMILLKNNSNTLPLTATSAAKAKVSVFGKNSANPVLGGSGSGSGTTVGMVDLYTALEEEHFELNPSLTAFYKDNTASGTGRGGAPGMGSILYGLKIGETPWASYTSTIKSSFANYKDAAIVVLSRIGGEGYDLPRSMRAGAGTDTAIIDGATSKTDHYLQLDANEKALITGVTDDPAFGKVIVVINSSEQMELGELKNNDKIDAIVWIGGPGNTGLRALGRILNGKVNPSGRLVDTYAANFLEDPAVKNFGNNGVADGNRITLAGGAAQNLYEVSYEEGIYVGYRYYETRGFTEDDKATSNKGDYTWYNNNVVYPLGYGLSYTNFTWTINPTNTTAAGAVAKDDTITINVDVKNTGSKAGKDVVQLYYSAPYYENGIEKAHVVLGDFAKTDLLAVNATQTVTLKLKVQDMASYDYNDANGNGFKGYEVEAGSYKLYVSKNAHSWADPNVLTREYTVAENTNTTDSGFTKAATANKGLNGFAYRTDSVTGKTIVNRFDDVSAAFDESNANRVTKSKLMSRTDFAATFPVTVTAAELSRTQAQIDAMTPHMKNSKYNLDYDEDKPWELEGTTEPITAAAGTTTPTAIQFREMVGVEYEDEKWTQFVQQLTYQELVDLCGDGGYKTAAIARAGVPQTHNPDGPVGIGNNSVNCVYASSCVVAATWSVEIAEGFGKHLAEEAIWGASNNTVPIVSGWYAPAVNIHRTPFSGRNFEYFSEDGVLSGKIAGSVVRKVTDMGVICYTKHFALNDQETNRDTNGGVATWATEQAMRELYLKPFELCVKDDPDNKLGGSLGIMSSFNRIGNVWAGGVYALQTEVLRNEWGFKGVVITDFHSSSVTMNPDLMIRAGNDLSLAGMGTVKVDTSLRCPTQIKALQTSVKNILYAVSRTNIMRNENVLVSKTNLPAGVIGATYSAKAETIGIYENVAYALKTGSQMPTGLSLNASTGEITGTIAATVTAQTYNFTITFESDGFKTSERAYSIAVSAFAFSTAELNDATKGLNYSATLKATGVTQGITYRLKEGSALPEGITLATGGRLSGTPTKPGVYTFIVEAVYGNLVREAEFTIKVLNEDGKLPSDEGKSGGCGGLTTPTDYITFIGGMMLLLTVTMTVTSISRKRRVSAV